MSNEATHEIVILPGNFMKLVRKEDQKTIVRTHALVTGEWQCGLGADAIRTTKEAAVRWFSTQVLVYELGAA